MPHQVSLEETQGQHLTLLTLHRAEPTFHFNTATYSYEADHSELKAL